MSGENEKTRYRVDLGVGSPGERSFLVRALDGEERLSAPFRFEARVANEEVAGLDPESLLGAPAAVVITRGAEELRCVRGVVSEAAVALTRRGAPELRVVIEPLFALLREKSDARVMVNRTVPDIVTSVLAEGGVPVSSRLQARYPERPYCVQLGETDFDFVARLLSEEGIFYRFDDDGALLLCDGTPGYDDSAARTLPFRSAAGAAREQTAIHEIAERAKLGPSGVTLRDFNPEKPRLDMDVTAASASPGGAELYDFPGNYAAPAEGARRARLVAEALSVASAGVVGATDEPALSPGSVFTLAGGPAEIADGAYVITALSHTFEIEQPVSIGFSALAGEVVYRPEPVARPEPMGLLTGFVTGPEGADIHTDEMGRVKVWFPFDGRSPKDDSASSFIPVLQDNTGHSLAIPRVGWEVLVGFVEGDPDRPVVLGRVYNGADPFPEPLPANKTVSTLRSLSSPSRAGHNEIRLEDRAAREQLFVQAERDQRVLVARDRTEKVTASETSRIGGDELVSVGANQTVKVGQSHVLSVGGDERFDVRERREREVGGDDAAAIGGSAALQVGSGHKRRIRATDAVTAAKIKENIGVLDLEVSLKKNTSAAATGASLTVGGALLEIAAGNKKEQVKGVRKETIGGLLFTKSAAEVKIRSDLSRKTTVGGLLRVKAQTVTLKGEKKLRVTAPVARLEGKKGLVLVVGTSVVHLSEDIIAIHADAEIVFEATGETGLAAPRTDTIFVGGKSVATAGTGHAGLCEEDMILPDGKPPAVPYLNIARSNKLVASTSRTFLNGYDVWTEQGHISASEAVPVTPGVGQTSGTFRDQATAFATFQTVLIEGQLPIRLGDPTVQNAGNCQGRVVTGATADQAIADWIAASQDPARRGLRMRVAGMDGGRFADGGFDMNGGREGAGAVLLASHRQGGPGGGAMNAANRGAAPATPCLCGALIVYGRGDTLGDLGVFAGHIARDLEGKYPGRITIVDIRFKAKLMAYLESWPGPKLAELHILCHSIGAGLFIDYGGADSAASRVAYQTSLQYWDPIAYEWKNRKATHDGVRRAEIGGLLTDDLVHPEYLAKQPAIRSKFCTCAPTLVKLWGCNAGKPDHVYSDGGPEPYYWRALNEKNTPKPPIAQALADYLGVTTYGAKDEANVQVEVKDKNGKPEWISSAEYEARFKKKPSGVLKQRLHPKTGDYEAYQSKNPLRPPAVRTAESTTSGEDTIIFEA